MQRAMAEVNADAAAAGLPAIEMGIGINSGEAVLGNIGSDHYMKYGTIGANVNLTARIESCTVGGQILANESLAEALGPSLTAGDVICCEVKGCAEMLRLTEVLGLCERQELDRPPAEAVFVALRNPVPLRVGVLEGKTLARDTFAAEIVQLSSTGARIAAAVPLELLANIKMTFSSGAGAALGEAYAKVVARDPAAVFRGERLYTVRFTDLPPSLAEALRDHGGLNDRAQTAAA